jgi:flagellar biosynthesis GTPase FlhF
MKAEIYTFRAATLAEALTLVRQHLGPDAAVLETRQVGTPLLRMFGGPVVEVAASTDVEVPSRLPAGIAQATRPRSPVPAAELQNYRARIRQNLETTGKAEASLVERLAAKRGA